MQLWQPACFRRWQPHSRGRKAGHSVLVWASFLPTHGAVTAPPAHGISRLAAPARGDRNWPVGVQRAREERLFGEAVNTHRASIGLPMLDNVRDYVFTHRPWLASDPTLSPWQPTELTDAVQTGAWILPDARPLRPSWRRSSMQAIPRFTLASAAWPCTPRKTRLASPLRQFARKAAA